MKLDAKAFANAAALIVAAIYVVCVAVVAIAPDFFLSIANSWIHALDLTKIKDINITAGSFIWGLITIVIVSWVVDYFFAVAYNSLIKRPE